MDIGAAAGDSIRVGVQVKRRGFLATLAALPFIRELPPVGRWRSEWMSHETATPDKVLLHALLYGSAVVHVPTMRLVLSEAHDTYTFPSPPRNLDGFYNTDEIVTARRFPK